MGKLNGSYYLFCRIVNPASFKKMTFIFVSLASSTMPGSYKVLKKMFAEWKDVWYNGLIVGWIKRWTIHRLSWCGGSHGEDRHKVGLAEHQEKVGQHCSGASMKRNTEAGRRDVCREWIVKRLTCIEKGVLEEVEWMGVAPTPLILCSKNDRTSWLLKVSQKCTKNQSNFGPLNSTSTKKRQWSNTSNNLKENYF